MGKTILLQQAVGEAVPLLRLTQDIHADYCKRQGFDYLPMFEAGEERDAGKHVYWGKCALLRWAGQQGFSRAIWLDADCLIVDPIASLNVACYHNTVGLTWHDKATLPEDWAPTFYDHYNAGAMYCSLTPTIRQLLDVWWTMDDNQHFWHDQHSLNQLLKVSPHLVTRLSHQWNSVPGRYEDGPPVVMAWHGMGSFEKRLELMKEAVAKL